MPGIGTITNVCLILVGGTLGMFIGKFIKSGFQDSLIKTCGVSVLFIGIGGALEGMLSAEGVKITSSRGAFIVIVLLVGTVIGELIDIEGWFERFGEWLKVKTGNARDPKFVEGFLNASLTVCIGAMAIVGPIEDSVNGDISILVTKGILDLIIIMVMTGSMGKGPIFSFIPVGVLQGLVTVLAVFIKPVLTEPALDNLSMIGSILIFCVGINLVWGKKIKVANMLPAVVIAVVAAFMPWFA